MAVLPPLRIRVRLFAMQRETAGMKEIRLEVPLGSTVDDAWNAVVATVPALAPGRAFLRFAVNGRWADPATPLADGDEVACIPPVSGGAGDEARDEAGHEVGDHVDDAGGAEAGLGRCRILEIRAEPFPPDLLSTLVDRLATDEDGGVVAFIGRTRVTPGTPAPGQEPAAVLLRGRVVEGLEYEAFEPMALEVLARIADEIGERWGVTHLAIVHRTGAVPLGEMSVVVVAASPHRDAAFEAARYAIDETKARAPIWKAEHFADG
ncbi:MAG TPA: molybdenum cofactor biosynthesis protein MoaE, partial [Candidatus Limnocylindrales bacterium]